MFVTLPLHLPSHVIHSDGAIMMYSQREGMFSLSLPLTLTHSLCSIFLRLSLHPSLSIPLSPSCPCLLALPRVYSSHPDAVNNNSNSSAPFFATLSSLTLTLTHT